MGKNRPTRPCTFSAIPAAFSVPEKLLLGMFVAAAGLSIAYGFWSLLDLVEHWASFETATRLLL